MVNLSLFQWIYIFAENATEGKTAKKLKDNTDRRDIFRICCEVLISSPDLFQ